MKGRPPNPEKGVRLNTVLPADLRAKLDRRLHDQSKGYIPVGAYSRFIVGCVNEWLERREKP
jgi:hypothetical protein